MPTDRNQIPSKFSDLIRGWRILPLSLTLATAWFTALTILEPGSLSNLRVSKLLVL